MIKQLKINKMKNYIIGIVLCIFTLNAMAQIEMFDESVQKKVEEEIVFQYDSLRNITTIDYRNGEDYKYALHYLKGQTLMYCGDPYAYKTKNDFEKGEYYIVDSVSYDTGLYLTNIKTGKQVVEKDISNDNNYKWVVVGYYEKMKSLYLNKELVYVGTEDVVMLSPWRKENNLINLETDTVTTDISVESMWTCIGVQVKPRKKDEISFSDKRSPIILIVDNSVYGKHYCYLESEFGMPYHSFHDGKKPLVCGRFLLKSDFDKLKESTAKRKADLTKKYGASNANLIIAGKVRIGMTKAMCEEAWGTPDSINKTSGSWGTHEQWVYGSSYLYFEGNKLTAIQN